jgi:hypothetical protein
METSVQNDISACRGALKGIESAAWTAIMYLSCVFGWYVGSAIFALPFGSATDRLESRIKALETKVEEMERERFRRSIGLPEAEGSASQ